MYLKGGKTVELTRSEVELLNAYNSVPSMKKTHVLNLVKEYAVKNQKPKYKYTSKKLCKRKTVIDIDKGQMIFNGIPEKTYFGLEGYCYIGADSNWVNHYKVGRTNDPFCHSRKSQTINPNYKILFRTKNIYQDSRKLESEIHDFISQKRVELENCFEWFELSEEELKAVIKKYDFVKMETLLTSSNK